MTTQVGRVERPLFSIIIPAKNEGRYIASTISAILDQLAVADIAGEVIIVDGGSQDDTVSICNSMGVRVITDVTRAGNSIAGGRNVGAEKSVGDILLHTDADVRIPNLANLLLEAQRYFTNSEFVAATTRIFPHPNEAKISDRAMHAIFNFFIRWSIPLGAFLAKGECQIVKRSSFFFVGGYNDQIVVGEDCALFYNLKKIGKIKYMKDFCVTHSMRRFRRYGYIKLLAIYAREAVFLLLFRRNYLRGWEEAR